MPKRSSDVAAFERIQRWAANPDTFAKLHPDDSVIFERWNIADNLMRRYPSRKDCANMLSKRCEISLAQAYRDLANAQVLFGTINMYNKDYIKNWLIEDIFKMIQKAKEKGDMKAWATAHTNLIKAVGLDREEKNPLNPEDIEPHSYYSILVAGGKQIKIDLNQIDKIPMESRSKIIAAIDETITEDIAFQLIQSTKYESLLSESEPAEVDSAKSEG